MKKSINLKPLIIAVSALAVLAVAVTLLFANGVFKSSAGEAPREFKPLILHVGKYMHESGDESKYIEVFDDGTIQIFGLDFFEIIKNHPGNVEIQKTMSEEEFKNYMKDDVDWKSMRHKYRLIPEVELIGFIIDENDESEQPYVKSGISYIDEKTLQALPEGDGIYIFKG